MRVAHLRAQPPLPPIARELELGWRGRLALLRGDWKVSAEQVDRARPRWGDAPQTTAFERGRYLASVTCSERHGLDFGGDAAERAPSLAILAAYTPEQFRHLIRSAEPVGGRRLDEDMLWVTEAPFTDAEIDALYRFLRASFGFEP